MKMLRRHLPRLKIFLRNFSQTQAYPHVQTLNGDVLPVFRNAVANNFADKIALRDEVGTYTYRNLFLSAKELSEEISRKLNGKTNERVLFMTKNDANYLITLWAIWMSGQIAVPLSNLHPQNLLLYYTNDCQAQLMISSPKFKELMERVAKNAHTPLLVLDMKNKMKCAVNNPQKPSDLEAGLSPEFYNKNSAMILYTSGTTGNPKGAVLTHKNLYFQSNMLINAWNWTGNDVILHSLPLHHVHGIVNALLCPLYAGAKTVMLDKFDANTVWTYLLGINAKPEDRKINTFMAVPTIYSKLIREYDRVFGGDSKMVDYIRNTLKNKMRLMVSGSAPLPEPVFEKWFEISGHRLLERYGMTETGMCLSNLYDGPREPGYVGVPLPGVSVRIAQKDNEGGYLTLVEASNNNGVVTCKKDSNVATSTPKGHLLVKSNGVFKEYFNRPEATRTEFTVDDWFSTGDISQYDVEKKMFKIMGRDNIDIIKSGGYKLSAIEIEMKLLSHTDIKECSVVGLPDEEYGHRVAAIVVLKVDKYITLEGLTEWASTKLPKYSIPTVLKVVPYIPKNEMGKVNKKELLKTMFSV